jgi:two-component system CheB/CheR fusion protein
MKAANEEILSSNEELQSTNEELETAKEELQSSNEELVSLNEEMQHRNAELSRLGSDLSNLLAGVDIPVLVVDAELRIRRFTPVAEKLFNLIGADVGRPFSQIASNLDVDDWAPLFAEVTGSLRVVEREVRDRNGHWYTLRMRPFRTPENRIDGVLLVLLDVDTVKRALEQLRQSRHYAESIVETIRESLLVLDGEFRVRAANRTFYRTFRVAAKETLGTAVFDLGDRQWNIPALRKLLEEVLPHNSHFEDFAVEQQFHSIGFRHMLINARRIHEQGDGPRLILLAIEDVTEKKRAEEDLRRSESTVRALLDSAAQGILAVRADGKIVLANRETEKMFGYEHGALIGCGIDLLLPPENRNAHAAHRNGFFAAPRSRPMGIGLDLAGVRRDGTRFPVEISLSYIETGEGRLGVAFVTDISQRRQAEAALRENAEIMQVLSDNANIPIIVNDAEGVVTQENAAAVRLLGDFRGRAKARLNLFDKEIREQILMADQRILATGESEVLEITVPQPEGKRAFLVSKMPRRDESGKIVGLINVGLDITERKKIEAAAMEYQNELQTLTARLIAAQEDQSKHLARELHDVFSQKLAAVAMDISVLQQRPPRLPEGIFKELGKLGAGIGSLARGIHDMSRQLHPSILDDLGLAAALKEECRVFSEIQGVPVTFRAAKMPKSLPEEIALCIYRVAQEILRNIAQHAGAREVHFHLAATPSEIRLSVQDIGGGFDLVKVTGKKGLGLISMEERVRLLKGTFEIQSHPGQGTRVEVHVPRRGVEERSDAPAHTSGRRSSGRDRRPAPHPRTGV